jgi:hypothetical protein
VELTRVRIGLSVLSTVVGCLLVISDGWARRGGEPDISDYADDGFGNDLSAYLLCNFAYHGLGIGVGAQFAFPILPSGFLEDPWFRDALHVEGGIDFARWGWDEQDRAVELMIVAPQLGLRYAVYVAERFAVFVSLKIGAAFADADGVDQDTRFYWSTTAGVFWDLTEIISLRGELGWGPYRDVLHLGVLFRL